MESFLGEVCAIHQIPLKNGRCLLCEKEKKESEGVNKKVIVGKKGTSSKIEDNKNKCPECGQKLPSGAQFCLYCGAEIKSLETPEENDYRIGYTLEILNLSTKEKASKCNLNALSKPAGFYGEWKGLEFMYYPENRHILIQNPKKMPWYIVVNTPLPVFNRQEIRIGEIGFILKYAGIVTQDLTQTRLVIEDINTNDESLIIDCLECIHPNFKGISINIEGDEMILSREVLKQYFGLGDEKYLKNAGVSSKKLILKKLGYWWYIFPQESPNILLRIPPFFIPFQWESMQLISNNHFYLMKLK